MEFHIKWNNINGNIASRATPTLQNISYLRFLLQKRSTYFITTLLLVLSFVTVLLCYIWMTCPGECNSLVCKYTSECVYFYPTPKATRYAIENKFLISNVLFCHVHSPYMLVLVPSRTGCFDERVAIRETYGQLSRDKISKINEGKVDGIIRTLFILGTSDNNTVERLIFKEHLTHADILQIDIVDSYYNLTGKLLHALKWIDLFCSHVTYILKADDDVFVNISILLEQLKMLAVSETGNVWGKIYGTDKHLKVYRKGKWGVSYDEYPLDTYPPYAQGTLYTMTRNLVPKILQSAHYFPYLHIEDVFITGVAAGKIHGAVFVKLNKTSDWGDPIPNPCKFAKNGRLAQHKMTPFLMRQTWKALMSFSITCNTFRGRGMLH